MTFPTRHTVNLRFLDRFSTFIFSQTLFFFLLTFSITALITTSISLTALATEQPSEGPGGTDYSHNRVISHKYGDGPSGYYIFEPAQPKPTLAPLIVFIHGFTATAPETYGDWIDHIVKKGNIVVYPVYQRMIDFSRRFTSNTIEAVLDAIDELQSANHVEPDLDRLAAVGHSMGGVMAANIAALARESGLPAVKAVMSVQPGKAPMPPIEDLSKIPSATLLLTVVGDRDMIVGDKDAKKIFRRTPQIPLDNKDFITLVSDRHGDLSLTANHFAPCCMPFGGGLGFGTDALDYYGLWKLFDALTDAAFYGENREYALGNTPQQRYMGKWSDGTPIKELIVTDNP